MKHCTAAIKLAAIAMLAFVCSAINCQAATEEQLIEIYSHAYNSSGKLSNGDFRQIVKIEILQSDWNAALTPLVRGLRDSNMVPEEWARMARRSIDEAAQIRVRMSIASSQIEDSSARGITKEISDINNQILTAWEDIRSAIQVGNNDQYRRAGMRAQSLAQEKANIAGPILRRLREKIGDKAVDGSIERELRELARRVGI